MFFKKCVLLFCLSLTLASNLDEKCEDNESVCVHIKTRCKTLAVARKLCPKSCGTCPRTGACAVDNGGCAHICSSSNNIASCSCYEGYRLDSNGYDCQDINECEERPNICENSFCKNYKGSYNCTEETHCEMSGLEIKSRNNECCIASKPDEKCGQNPQVLGRIVGGDSAIAGSWPWMVYILLNKATLCGGTLIDAQWVLTAGHCFIKLKDGSDIDLYFGLYAVANKDSGHVRKRRGVEVILHENWNATYYPYRDIALVKLDKPITSTAYIYPVCLPRGERPKPGYKCWVTGYGTTTYKGRASKQLRQVDVPIRTDQECIEAYKKTKFPIDPKVMFCAGYKQGGKDACQGDSGGPLVCQRCQTCSWYIYGVTSFGYKCAEANFYGVYSNIEVFEKWISSKIGKPLIKDQMCDGDITYQAKYMPWGPWSSCSVSCDEGIKVRNRICRKFTAQAQCEGSDREEKTCFEKNCTTWGTWGDWGTCSVSCSGGVQTRFRECLNGNFGEPGCDIGETFEEKKCNQNQCPSYGTWSAWSECSTTCGDGIKTSERVCMNGNDCEGPSTKSVSCSTGPCIEVAKWSEWTSWSDCSSTCGEGLRTKFRECLNGGVGDGECQGSLAEVVKCVNPEPCQAEVKWEQWGDWSECSVTSGLGTYERFRDCKGANPGDAECPGDAKVIKSCNASSCLDYSEWSAWSKCSKEISKTRIKVYRGSLVFCKRQIEEKEDCGESSWSEWSTWQDCSVRCGNGTQTRTRSCVGDRPNTCPGLAIETKSCFQECQTTWSEWGQWSKCSDKDFKFI